MGLKGPEPRFIIGNMGQMTKKGFHACFKEWEKEYGKVYGVYRAKQPSIVIHDPDMLREIMVKQFAAFPNRQSSKIADVKPWRSTLQFLMDDHWRHVRNTLSPGFSTGKLKHMLPVIQRCCRNLVKHVQQKAEKGEDVDTKVLSNAFSMDVTAGTGFGMEVCCLQNPEEPFGVVANQILYPPQWVFTLHFLFPFLSPVLHTLGISIAPKKPIQYMFDIISAAIKERRQDNKDYKDHLQTLVDAQRQKTDDTPVDPEIDHRDDLKTSSTWNRKGLTEDEIYANSLNFLLAGYENTASGIAFLLYNLAGSPHCLRKLQDEVDAALGKDEVDYRVVSDMPYLEMCLNETLRLYPPGLMLDRTCIADTEIKTLHVPKGMLITIPVYSVHTDPTNWPDPLKFDPERHTSEARATRHPFSFMPFGIGPRNCIGMRMSQLEVKMAVACIVQKFSPFLCEQSVFPAKVSTHVRLGPEEKMWIKFKPRA
ncbi:hypothetical protein V1264_004445 [Littorina saxatilis]